ncbi:MAG: serine/threonine-protein kinase [Myxococcota bacterium]
MLQVGDHIGRFTVLGLIGEGGIATVYRVQHSALQSVHALKLLHQQRGDMAKRLLQEGRIQARLHHPNVVAVTDVLEIDGQTGLVMEYVDGSSLRDALDEGRLDRDEALSLFQQILSGVAAAHRSDVLHRDLKPANILLAVTSRGIVAKVTDFGIAKVARDMEDKAVTRAGSILGTPGYMAPEQVEDSGKVDRRADVFALGCLLYEMLTGDAPFLRNELFATLNATTKGEYVPIHEREPDLPPEVHLAVARALEVDPNLRFPNCEEFAEALYGEGFRLETGDLATPFDTRIPMDAPRPPTNPTIAPNELNLLRRTLEMKRPSSRGPDSSDTFAMGDALPRRDTGTIAPPQASQLAIPSTATTQGDAPAASLAPPGPRPAREPVRVPDEYELREEFERLKPVAQKDEEGGAIPGLNLASDTAKGAHQAASRTLLLFIRASGFVARYVAGPAALLVFFGWREAQQGARIVDSVREEQITARTQVELALQKQVTFVREMGDAGADTSTMARYVDDYRNAPTLDDKLAAGDKLLAEMQRELADLKLTQREGLTQEDEIKRRALERQIQSLSKQFKDYRALESTWSEKLDTPEAGLATALGMAEPVEPD